MELPIQTITAVDEPGHPRSFHYSILVDEISVGNFSCEDYGIQVREESGSCVSIPNITTSTTRIHALMELLIRHKVSPTALPDVVADWV